MEWEAQSCLVTPRVSRFLAKARLSHGKPLTLYEIRDCWPVPRMREIAGFSSWSLVSLARSLALLGLECEFAEMMEVADALSGRLYPVCDRTEPRIVPSTLFGRSAFEFVD